MAVRKYIKKPLVIEAIQWKGNNSKEVLKFCNGKATLKRATIILSTIVGNFPAEIGYYLIKGKDGEMSPCSPEVFAELYESVD